MDIGGQHGRRFVLLCHTHRSQRRPSIPHLYKQERKRPTRVRRRLSRTQALVGRVIPGRCVPVSGMKMRSLVGFVRPPRIPLEIRPMRRTSVVVVRKTDALLCGGYKWVSRFEAPCICTRWAGERCVEQMSRLHGTASHRECDSTATKLSRFDACEDWKVVLWCKTQASRHNSQGVVHGGVDEGGISTAAPNRSAVLCSPLHQGQCGCSQRCCSSSPAGASKAPQECDA